MARCGAALSDNGTMVGVKGPSPGRPAEDRLHGGEHAAVQVGTGAARLL
jgi:hypothetical protein